MRARTSLRPIALLLLSVLLVGMRSAETVETRSDVLFRRTESGALRLDLYRPRGVEGRLPTLILVHGGSWRHGDKTDWEELAPRYARAGFLVVVPNYRLSPPGGETIFPGHLIDVREALEWVRNKAHRHGGSRQRVGMIGTSAGAHLTLLKAMSGVGRPDAIAVFSPPVELARLYRRGVIASSISNFLGCTPDACEETYRRASPLYHVDARTPPVFLAYSAEEALPAGQGRALARRLDAQDVPHRVRELPGSAHGLTVGRKVIDGTIAFMQNRLSRD